MRPIQRFAKFGLLTLLMLFMGTAAYAQTCDRYLNVTDGDDTNTGLTATTSWRSFEFAYDNAPNGSTICTAAGEYFQDADADGITLSGNNSVTYLLQTFGGSELLLFSEGPFVVDTQNDPGQARGTVTIAAGSGTTAPTVRFGAGVQNFGGALTQMDFQTGTLNITIANTTIGPPVNAINRDTDAIFTATPVFGPNNNRVITITGDDDATLGAEVPANLGGGMLNINTTAKTVTSNKAHTLTDGGLVNMNGAGNATFTGLLSISTAGAAQVNNTGTGALNFNAGITISATGNPGNVIANNANGSITVASTTFTRNNPSDGGGTPNDPDFFAQILNTNTGALTTGLINDVPNADGERVLVEVDNGGTGTFTTGGDIGDNLRNDGGGRVEISHNTVLDGNLINLAGNTIDVNGNTLTLSGGQTYNNDGDIVGSGTVAIEGASTIDAGGPGGDLPNVVVNDGNATINATDINGSLTINDGDATINVNAINGNLTINSGGSNNVVNLGSGITGSINIAAAATTDINGSPIGGSVTVDSGVATVDALNLGTVTTNGGGGITFDGFAPTTIGSLIMNGTGTVQNTVGTPLTLTGSLDIQAATFIMNDDVTTLGMFNQDGGVFDFGGTSNTLNVRGDFTRTGGAVMPGNGTLRFTGEGTQTFQGGPNFEVFNAEVVGLNTNLVFQDGSLQTLGDFTIGNNASVDLDDRLIRLLGLASTFTNDGSYTSGPDGKVIFQGPAGSAQVMRGNGLYGNIEVRLGADADNVTLGATPGLEITMSGILTFQRGGIDLAGQGFDLSTANRMPLIRRNLSDSGVDGPDGGDFTLSGGTFNSSGTDYDLEYFGAPPAGTLTSTLWNNSFVEDVLIATSGANALGLDANHSFSGNLTVNGGATLALNGFTLTSNGVLADNVVNGAITGAATFNVSSAGSLSGTGTVSDLTVNTPAAGALDVSGLVEITDVTVNSGSVTLGLGIDTEGTAATTDDTNGDIDDYSQTGGTVTLTTAIDIGENSGTGSFDLTGGTFGTSDFNVMLYSSLTADNPGTFDPSGTGYFVFVDGGILNGDTGADGSAVAVPRVRIDPEREGGTTVTVVGPSRIGDVLDHVSGTLDLNGRTLTHAGTVWNYNDDTGTGGNDADGYGTTGTFLISGNVTATLDKTVDVPNLTKGGSTTLSIVDGLGNVPSLNVDNLFVFNAGVIDQVDGCDIVLQGAGRVFDFNAGTFISGVGGELVFDSATNAAQSMDNAANLSIPRLRIENDVTVNGNAAGTADDGSVFTVTEAFRFGSSDSDLTFLDANGNIAFVDNTLITRDGAGTIEESVTPGPLSPVFPTDGFVDVTYLAAVGTSTELPAGVGVLTVNPGAGDVDLNAAVTANEAVNLTSGNLDTSAANTVTVTADATVTRSGGTINDDNGNNVSDVEDSPSSGSNIVGTDYTLVYDVTTGSMTTQSGEFPGGANVDLDVMGDDNQLTLHQSRSVATFDVMLDETFANANPSVNFNGNDITVTGDVNITESLDPNTTVNFAGTIADFTGSGQSDLNVGGDLSLGAGADIGTPGFFEPINVNVAGNADLQGNYFGGTFDVEGNTTIGGTFSGTLNTAGDVEVTTGALGAAFITFNGFSQAFDLNGSIFPAVVTLAQSPDADGNTPTVTMDPDRGDAINVGTLNLNGGVLVTGPNNTVILPTPNPNQNYNRNPPAGVESHVAGNVGISVPAGTPGSAFPGNGRFEYPVGSLEEYRAAAITFESEDPAIVDAVITVNHVDMKPAGTAGFPIGNVLGASDFYWLVTSSTSFGAAQTFELEFLGSGFTDYNDVEDIEIIRRLDGDVTNTWQAQGGSYSNFETTPPDSDPLVRVTSTQGGLVAQGSLFTFGSTDASGLAFLQVIHGAANTDFSTVDIYIDGVLSLDNFAYCDATTMIGLDVAGKGTGSSATFTVDVAPGNSTSAADGQSFSVDLTEGESYIAIAVDNAAGDDVDLFVAGDVRTVASDPTAVDVLLFHGIADAPAVDVRLFDGNPQGGGPLLLGNVEFGGSANDYLTVDAGTFTVEYLLAGTTDQALGSNIDLTGLGGQAVVVMATGLLNPPVGREGSRSATTKVISADGNVRTGAVVTDVEGDIEIPSEFALEGNYPNPFNPSTTLQFDLPETAEVTIEIVNVLGQRVMTIPTQTVAAGANRTVQLDASNLASGTYLYRLIAVSPSNTWVNTGTMTLLK